MLKMPKIIIVVLVLLSGITVQAQTTAPDVPYLNLNQSFYYYNDCSFNGSVFNADCVKSSCSGLTGMCTNVDTGCSNISTALSACAQQPNATICGVPMAHMPICLFEVNLFGISAETVVNALTGNLLLTAGAAFTDGMEQTTYCVSGSGPYTVTINCPNIYSYATSVCTFVFFNNTIVAPSFDVQFYMDIQATATIDVGTVPPTINTTVTQFTAAVDTSNFNDLPDILQKVFNVTFNYMLETFGTDQAAANFLASYAAAGLQANLQSCNKTTQ